MTHQNRNISNLVKLAMNNDAKGLISELQQHNYNNYDYSNAISKAAGYGHIDAIKVLSECREITLNDFAALSKAVYWAARHGRLEVVSFLFEKFNLHADMDNSASFRVACQHGQFPVVEYLFEKGAYVHASHNEAMKKAIRHEHDNVAAFLIDKGACFVLSDYDLTDTESFQVNKFTPPELKEYDMLLRAATRGMEKTMTIVMDKGLPVDVLNEIMIKSASYGMFDVFKLALEHGADVNARNVEALSEAARFNHTEVLVFILRSESMDRNIGMQRAIKKALDGGNEEIIDILLPFVNSSSIDFDIPNLIRRCLRFGQDNSAIRIIDAHTSLVSSELFISQVALFGSLKVLNHVMTIMPVFIPLTGSYVDAAIKGRKFESAEYLLENGGNIINASENLVICAKHGKKKLTQTMILAGADVNHNKGAALVKAIAHNHTNCVELLFDSGATLSEDVVLDDVKISDEMNALLQAERSSVQVSLHQGEVKLIAC